MTEIDLTDGDPHAGHETGTVPYSSLGEIKLDRDGPISRDKLGWSTYCIDCDEIIGDADD